MQKTLGIYAWDFTLDRLRSILTLGLAILYLGNVFFKSPVLESLSLVLVVLVLIPSLALVEGSTKVIGYAFFLVSTGLLLYYHAPLRVWEEALEENLYLVVMFTLVPLLSIPIRHGGYFESLQALFKRYVTSNNRFYLLVSMMSAMVGVLVNMAVVPLMHQISQASSRSEDKKLLCAAISRGFATCAIWAPTTAAVGLILKVTGVSWLQFFPFALFLGIVAGVTGFGMTLFTDRGKEQTEKDPGPEEKLNWRKLGELGIFGLVLIASIALISLHTGIQTIIVVSLGSLIFPFLWLGMIGRLPSIVREFKGAYLTDILPRLKNELVLFIGAGLLATSISYSHLGDYVPKMLQAVVGYNAYLFATVLLIANFVLTVAGFHPIIMVTVIGSTVNPALYGISPLFMALILAMCWSMGTTVSPSAGNIIAISGLAEQSPLHVGLRWNGPYVITAWTLLLFMLFGLRGIGIL